MYRIYLDGELMCDSRIEELALVNPVTVLEENKAGSFSFTILPAHPKYDAIYRKKSIIKVEEDGELLFCGECTEATVDFFKQKKVSCEGEFAYFNDSIQRPARYQNVTVRGLLEAFLNNHNAQVGERKRFKLGIVTVADSNNSLYCYTNMESTMKCLKEDLVDDLGGFFRVRYEEDGKYLDYLAKSPNTNSQIIKLGKNLVDFKTNYDATDIKTAVIPLGAKLEESDIEGLEKRLTIESVNDGRDYVYNADAVEEMDWIYATAVFDDVTNAEILKSKGERWLAETQFENMVIEAKAVDLHLENKDVEAFKISDQIRVLSPAHGLDKYMRLTKRTINHDMHEKDTVTLGKDERTSIAARTVKNEAVIRKELEKISPSDIVKSAVDNATQLIANAMGGYVVKTNDEILIMDTNDITTAQKVWRWNINGLGYSSTGIEGPYELAMTMDGAFVADMIKTGVFNANLIRAGIIQSQDGSSSWNLETGELHIKGKFSQKSISGIQSVKIENNQIDLHNWNGDGEFVGSIATGKSVESDRVGVVIGCKKGSDITISIIDSSGKFVPVFQVNGDSYAESPPWIKNTVNGTLFPKNSGGGITVENGLITNWGLQASSGIIYTDGVEIVVQNGLINSWSYK